MEITDHLWLSFIDQPQSDVFVFAMIYFDIYKYLVTEWNNGISINNIVTFNEYLEKSLMSIEELINIDESSH